MYNLYSEPLHIIKDTSLELFLDSFKDDKFVILCLGNDKYVIDSFGPLVGHYLSKRLPKTIPLFGTLQNPVDTSNIYNVLNTIKSKYPNFKILCIDSGMGHNDKLGSTIYINAPIKIKYAKNNITVGDKSILAIVSNENSDTISHSMRLKTILDLASSTAGKIACVF